MNSTFRASLSSRSLADRFGRAVLATALLAVAFVAVACGDDGDADPDETRSATLMLNWTPNAQHAGIYVALANGWYEEAGIDLEIVEPATAGVDSVVGSGGAEFGISQAESILPARAAGVPVVSIAAILPHNDSSFMALAASGIETPRDFEGKKYGGYGGALEMELLDALVACDGGDPTLVERVDVGNIDYLPGMEQERFDFVWVFEGWDTLRAREIEEKDIASVKFVDWLDCIPDWYTPTFIASEDVIADDPDLVRAFLEATTRGYEEAIADPAAAADALLDAAPELDEALVRASTEYHAPLFIDGEPWGTQSGDVWSEFEAFLRAAGLLEEAVDTAQAFTNDYLPE